MDNQVEYNLIWINAYKGKCDLGLPVWKLQSTRTRLILNQARLSSWYGLE